MEPRNPRGVAAKLPPPNELISESRTDTSLAARPRRLELQRKGVHGRTRTPATRGPRESLGTNGAQPVSVSRRDAVAEDFRGGAGPGAVVSGRRARPGGVGSGLGAWGGGGAGAGSARRAAGGRVRAGPRPRSHEPGAAAEARPAVPGPGGRPDPGSAGRGSGGSRGGCCRGLGGARS